MSARKKRATPRKAVALVPCYHSLAEEYVAPGEVLDISHLMPPQVRRFVRAGIIELVEEDNDGAGEPGGTED